ncbi:MAG: hypothetical protein K2J93_00545 [Anaeroplasmataceae bacterium]|nr:hypothetical protein [Anaeroplasmataceae bacterium]
MSCKYPIVLVHGIILKDIKFFKAFGRIEKKLKAEGHIVYTAKIDGFGTIENNAEQLKAHILKILEENQTDKVNLIAHSKGGLDSKYMIQNLDMEDSIASLTTLCTPHKGSKVATNLLRLPKFLIVIIAFWVNLFYRIFGDKKPDSHTVCKQLQTVEASTLNFSDKIYCQSYSTTLKRSRDDFIMGIPLIFSKHWEKTTSDGLVTQDSASFGDYKGDCIEDSISHSEIVDFMVKKKKKEKIYQFYINLCKNLEDLGF